MSNRRYTSQFNYSFERMPVELAGVFTQTAVTVAASKVTQGLTLTAVTWGTAANSITIAFTPGATAGAEVVTVTGNAISVQVETGVSTVTQVRTAMQASAACTALVTTTGTSSSTVATAAATPLLGGIDLATDVVNSQGNTSHTGRASGMTLSQTAAGTYKITLEDSFKGLIGASMMVGRATAVDLKPQLIAIDTVTAKTITFRLVAVATATSMANSDILAITLKLRN